MTSTTAGSLLFLIIVHVSINFVDATTETAEIENDQDYLAPVPGTTSQEDSDDEASAQQCAKAVESPLVLGGISSPASSNSPSGKTTTFISALTGIWTSLRCEIAPGPEFTYRRYVFFSTPQDGAPQVPPNPNRDQMMSSKVIFRTIQFKFSDPNCQLPIFAFSAEGELTVAQSMSRGLFSATPGSEETEVNVYRVSITVFNVSAFLASNFSAFQVRPTQGPSPSIAPEPDQDWPKSLKQSKLLSDDDAAGERASGEALIGRGILDAANGVGVEQETRRERRRKRKRRSLQFDANCNIKRLWPHLAEKIPSLAANNQSKTNLLLFEMFNDLEPTTEWFQWVPTNRPFSRISDEAERSRNEDRLECLKKAGFNIDELLLLRIERRKIYAENASNSGQVDVSILKTGQIFRGIFGELNYKPAMYGSNVLVQFKPSIAAICPVCASLAEDNVEENCYTKFFSSLAAFSANLASGTPPGISVADASLLLPTVWAQPLDALSRYDIVLEKSGRWTSTRCETRTYGVFLMRQLVFSQVSAAVFRGTYLYFEDPFCTIPTYDLEIGGDFRYVRGVFNPQPGGDNTAEAGQRPFAAAYLFNTNWARIRPRNLQAVNTLSEYSYVGNCGRASRWRLGKWQDVSQTGGCLSIGIRVPTEELQLVRIETSSDDANRATFLYVGDAQSKRPLSPSLMMPSAISTTGYAIDRPSASSAEVRMSLDYSLFEQIRPTSFLEPLARCQDLISLFEANSEKMKTTTTMSTSSTSETTQAAALSAQTFPSDGPEVYYLQTTNQDTTTTTPAATRKKLPESGERNGQLVEKARDAEATTQSPGEISSAENTDLEPIAAVAADTPIVIGSPRNSAGSSLLSHRRTQQRLDWLQTQLVIMISTTTPFVIVFYYSNL